MGNRRKFVRDVSLSALAFTPVLETLSKLIGIKSEILAQPFDDDFHFFGNNLTNLHFYFFNARITNKTLRRLNNGLTPYMIVRVPQQHISEQLLTENDFKAYRDTGKNTSSRISGFSFLAFELFPEKREGETNPVQSISLQNIQALLNWNNKDHFKLLIPEKQDFLPFPVDRDIFRNQSLRQLEDKEEQVKQYHTITLFKRACAQFFKKKDHQDFVPFTLLEIPEALYLTPYNDGDGNALMDTRTISKKRFVYQVEKGRIYRTIEEVWNAQMFFERSGQLTSPSFRATGTIMRKETPTSSDEAASNWVNNRYLPKYLDKREVVFLTSLGRNGNDAKEWGIHSKGLSLTGLGAITKFQYKNYNPPFGISLAEYEHHITLGRDEYIKVAHIGVISVTGQRALHVHIGQRKIRGGVSYMEFKEYVEIIQKEIVYHDPRLFPQQSHLAEDNREIPNYIHARTYPASYFKKDIIKSIEKDKLWSDRLLWGFANAEGRYLPGQWQTHYRRLPFKQVTSVITVTEPVTSEVPAAKKINCSPTQGDPMIAFWAVLEQPQNGTYQNCTLEFEGKDWNDRSFRFTSTFLFIDKKIIDKGTDACYNQVYAIFLNEDFERRHIRFTDVSIAYTPDYADKTPDKDGALKEELPNKQNLAKTDFLEYYFALAKETDGKTESGETIRLESIFNERLFPLFPQVKRAQLYIESIQGYSSQPLPSIIEYNQDYITYGYYGQKNAIVKDGTDKVKEANAVYNKAKLIFNHTEKFIQGKEKTYSKALGETGTDGYARIRNVFRSAGTTAGGIVNPDLDIESIGLVKQSIALGKNINEKVSRLTDTADKIEQFNPSDLLRQAPEIFNGISLLDILQEVFPDMEAPLNQIKNISGQIEELKDAVMNNPVFLEIRTQLENAKKQIENATKTIADKQKLLNQKVQEVNALKDQLNIENQFSEIQKYAETMINQYKISILEVKNGIIRISASDAVVAEFIASELIARADSFQPLIATIATGSKKLEEILKLPAVGGALTPAAKSAINNYITEFAKGAVYLLFDLDAYDVTKNEFQAYASIVKAVKARVADEFQKYTTYTAALQKQAAAFVAYNEQVVKGSSVTVLAPFQKALNEAIGASEVAQHIFNTRKEVVTAARARAANLLVVLRANANDAVRLGPYIKDIERFQTAVVNALDILQVADLSYYIDLFTNSVKNAQVFFSKLQPSKIGEDAIKAIKDTFPDSNPALKNLIQGKKDLLIKEFRDRLKNPVNVTFFIRSTDTLIKQYIETVDNYILTRNEFENVKLLGPANIPGLKELRENISEAVGDLSNFKKEFQQALASYEQMLKQQLQDEANGILKLVTDKIEVYQQQLLSNPDNAELANKYAKMKEMYLMLTSLSKKEIKYDWQTTSFKKADFGIVSFINSSDPKTSLSVNVRTIIHFQLDRFPPVVSKVEALAENRLSNFGISVMKSLIINFNEVSFIAGTDRKSKFDVKIRDVQFAGAFSFVQAFEAYLKTLMGNAFRVNLQPTSINIGYTLPIPSIKTPSFSFFNLTLNVDFWLHFNNQPMELGFSLGRKDNKFGITAGVYAGFGFFSIKAEPKTGLKEIEVGLEFGGFYGLSLGPIRGEVKLVVGLYYRKALSIVIIEGYFLCEGRVKLWWVTISARFYMGIKSQGGYVEGRCTVTYEVRLSRFYKRSFRATYYKKLAGAGPGSQRSGNESSNFYINALSASGSEEQKLLDIKNPSDRIIEPLDLKEWTIFINSYSDN